MRVLFATLFFPIFLVTRSGYLLMPATRACPYGRSLLPSSCVLTMSPFFPANRPPRTTTTFPAFIIFPMALSGTCPHGGERRDISQQACSLSPSLKHSHFSIYTDTLTTLAASSLPTHDTRKRSHAYAHAHKRRANH